MSGEDDAVIACGVRDCRRQAVGYVEIVGREGRAEVFIGQPRHPRQTPVCAQHLTVEATLGSAPLRPWRLVAKGA